jgi:hypothetical protein
MNLLTRRTTKQMKTGNHQKDEKEIIKIETKYLKSSTGIKAIRLKTKQPKMENEEQ